MKTKKPKLPDSITVIGKSWFDKYNGNSYCSAQILIDGVLKYKVPFEYGYGDYFLQAAGALLASKPETPGIKPQIPGGYMPLWQYCRDNNIKFYYTKQENCLKRDVIKWGESNNE